MGALDAVSVGILLAALLILAGILSSLVALRFGAPLLLVFLLVGMLAGEAGPLGIRFDDVRLAYTIGSVALALILFDGGLRTRYQTFRNVIGPAGLLATIGVLVTAALTAPAAVWALGLGWTEALLVGAVVASTDAAAVFFLLHAKGLRLRPRVSATLEVESGINDPFAIFLTIVLIEIILHGAKPWYEIASFLVTETLVGARDRLCRRPRRGAGAQPAQPAAGPARAVRGDRRGGDLRAGRGRPRLGLPRGLCRRAGGRQQRDPRPQRGRDLPRRRDLAGADRHVRGARAAVMAGSAAADAPAGARGRGHADVHRAPGGGVPVPGAVSVFNWREKTFMSWVGLRGAVGIFIASIPMLVGVPNAQLYFDVGFVVVLVSLLVQGWTIAPAARALGVSFPRADPLPRRVELDLPGQLEQEIVGYPLSANSPYLRRGALPNWARPTLVVRDERILSPAEADPLREGDYIYLLAPPERAQALDRFFVDMPPPARPDPLLLGDFFVTGEHTLGELAEIYGLSIAPEETAMTLADFIAEPHRPHAEGGRHRAARRRSRWWCSR